MPTLVLTGANRGIGLEFARQYSAEGWRVIATVRDQAKAAPLAGLKGVEVRTLDVTDFPAVEAFGRSMAGETVDLLVANAGISGPREMKPEHVDAAAWGEVFRVNVMAPIAIAGALLPALGRGKGKVVAISSRMGSVALNQGGSYAYRSSKAALNMAWSCFAIDHPELICAVLHPGWVQTDMGGASAPVKPADSVAGMRRVIAGLGKADGVRFYDFEGNALAW